MSAFFKENPGMSQMPSDFDELLSEVLLIDSYECSMMLKHQKEVNVPQLLSGH